MKILVTGATGFLGSHLVKSLLLAGNAVTILKRSFSDTWRIDDVMNQLDCYDLDKCELEDPFKDHGRFDAVIHTATCYGRKAESVGAVLEVNTLFPLKLLDAAALANTGLFINADTILPKFFNTYSLSKKQFAEWGEHFASTGKIRFVNIKLEHMYGPGDDESKFTTYVIKSCLANISELRLTQGEQKRDFVYIDDVVAAYLKILETNSCEGYQDFELGSGQSITIRQYVEAVHRMTGSETVLNFGAIAYRPGEVMESIADLSALRKIGWVPTVSLEQGIRNCLQRES